MRIFISGRYCRVHTLALIRHEASAFRTTRASFAKAAAHFLRRVRMMAMRVRGLHDAFDIAGFYAAAGLLLGEIFSLGRKKRITPIRTRRHFGLAASARDFHFR